MDRTVAGIIDHTILRADATRVDVLKVCEEARTYGFASVCVNGFWVSAVADDLAGSDVRVCAVVGFPLGAGTAKSKHAEAIDAMGRGARELDMVLNIGALKGGESAIVADDIATVVRACADGGSILKVILETALLTDEEKHIACQIAVECGADFVKTSTGFGPAGATVHDVALMRAAVGPAVGVKASGGIRTLENLRAMVAAGASRVGASASVAIVLATAE
ncbi:MAG: deoxyribose-phosphate aldolase [Bryobacteraceae bacterium]|nr:deoxyribose-phosphate aldolase [Bryobacteraceae bacterium]